MALQELVLIQNTKAERILLLSLLFSGGLARATLRKERDPSGELDMKKMLEDGQIVWIPNGTSVRIVQVGSFSSEVEVLSGEFKDRLLYVPGKFVVKPEKGSK